MKEHRGRFQAQGRKLEESEIWAKDVPISVEEGIQLITTLKNKIPEPEKKLREKAFLGCTNFVYHLRGNGGYDVGITGKPLKKSFVAFGQERVDLEIQSGVAFKS